MAQKVKNPNTAPNRKEAQPRKSKPVPKNGGFFSRNSFQIALFLLTFVVFGNGIYNEYALDDEFYTAGKNKLTQQGVKGIPKIFTTRTFMNPDGSGYAYRPIALSSFALEIQFFGEQPHVSHFFNVLLYAICIILLFAVLRRWFSAQGDWFSFFVCLLFLAHPLHTEVVDNIKCRDEILAMLFVLLAALFAWRHVETGKLYYIPLITLMFLTAMLSKHTVIPFVFLIPLAIWFFSDINWKKILLWYLLPLIAGALLTSALQKGLLPPQSRVLQAFENPLPANDDIMVRIATSFYVLGRYLWLHLIPHPLVYYYGYRYVPLVGWSNPIAIISLLVHLALGIIAIRELRKKTVLGFGILFYLINIAAYSNLLQAAPGVMAERFTYAASLGFCILVVWFVFRILKKEPAQFRWKLDTMKSVRTVLIVIALAYTVRSWLRNETWENKSSLYTNDMQYLHESAKANMLYGAEFAQAGMLAKMQARQLREQGNAAMADQKEAELQHQFLEARAYYKKASEIAPYYHTAWGNLGTTYFFLEDPQGALPYFYRSVKENPKYTEGYFNLGMAYDKLGKRDSAVFFFQKSIATDSSYVNAYDHLARIVFAGGQNTQGAIDLLHTAAKKKPDSELPWTGIATIYSELKDTASSAAALEMAAQINPSNVQRLYNLANYFRHKGDLLKYNRYMAMYQEEARKQEEANKARNQNAHRR